MQHFCYILILYLAILSQMYLPNERQSVWLDALRILYFAFPRKILATMNVFSQYVRQWACTLGRFPPCSHLESYSQAVCPQWVLPTSILIYLYRYCAICLLLYCMLTALGYYFLYIYILFLFLTSTSFSPHVGTTQTDILYSVTGKRQPLISDTFLISKQINDAETRPLSLPPPLVAH